MKPSLVRKEIKWLTRKTNRLLFRVKCSHHHGISVSEALHDMDAHEGAGRLAEELHCSMNRAPTPYS